MTIQEYFEAYCANISRQQALDESLFDTADREKWKQNLLLRAKEMREINLENSRILEQLQTIIKGELNDDIASQLVQAVIRTVYAGQSDAALQYPVMQAMAEYYEKRGIVSDYISCMFFAGYVEKEILFRSGALESTSTHADEMVIAQRHHYGELTDLLVRGDIHLSFHNLAVCSGNEHKDIERNFHYLQLMEEFWNSEDVQRLDGQNAELIQHMEDTRRMWLQLPFEESDLGTPACDYFCSHTRELFEKMQEETGGDVSKYIVQTYGPYLRSQVIQGKMSWDKASELFYVRYRDYMDQALNGRDDWPFICFGLIVALDILTSLVDRTDLETRRKYYGIINEDLSRFGQGKHHETQVDSTINQTLAEQCVRTIPLMGSRQEKEKALFNLVIKRQLPTYLHSMMTTKIATAVADAAWEDLPGYFDECGFGSKADFLDFVENGARFHDLGKIYITDIVNMQRRRLDEEEFHGIRRHPTKGVAVVENDPELSIYRDVILGHHRFYDGTGGYPVDFDNTASRVRKIIDIVTIADCMDAATDCYSRNYKPPKTFDMLLEEFKKDASVRYNPDIVGVLEKNQPLRDRLTRIVNEERLDMMYEAYKEGREKYI